jgi:hypothetical protein
MDTRRRYDGWLMLLLMALVGSPGITAPAHPNVAYGVHYIRNTRVHVVTVNLNDRSLAVKPMLAHNRLGRRQSFVSFLGTGEPIAQITGNFFSMRSSLPIGDIMIDGQMWYYGFVGSALAITHDNAPRIITFPRGWKYEWPGFENVLRGGVLLVENGRYTVAPRTQGFRDPNVYAPATRTAIGIRPNRRLLLVAVNERIYLSQLARIMLALGCRDAMAMDGGNSTGLAYDYDVKVMPRRALVSVLMVVERPVRLLPVPDELETLPEAHLSWRPTPPTLANSRQFRYSTLPATRVDDILPEETPLLPIIDRDLARYLTIRKRDSAGAGSA